MAQTIYDEQKLQAIYHKVIEEPNINSRKMDFIKCPQCGEEILMIPTLRVMYEAIENHICAHREQLKRDPIEEHQKAISIRLSLTGQVLECACKPRIV